MEGRRRIGGPVGVAELTHCAEPRHPKPSLAHVYTPEASQMVNLNNVGCLRAEEND